MATDCCFGLTFILYSFFCNSDKYSVNSVKYLFKFFEYFKLFSSNGLDPFCIFLIRNCNDLIIFSVDLLRFGIFFVLRFSGVVLVVSPFPFPSPFTFTSLFTAADALFTVAGDLLFTAAGALFTAAGALFAAADALFPAFADLLFTATADALFPVFEDLLFFTLYSSHFFLLF